MRIAHNATSTPLARTGRRYGGAGACTQRRGELLAGLVSLVRVLRHRAVEECDRDRAGSRH